MSMKKENKDMNRRQFLQRLGMGAGSALAMMAMEPLSVLAGNTARTMKTDGLRYASEENQMTYRVQHGSGVKISLLGFGMMRLPDDQEQVDELVDYAIAHGVNYFDTAPMYMGGRSEVLTGNTLSRFPRESYHVATKMSNQNRRLWSFDDSKRMYEQSFERLKVDYIDYYLLHSIGGGMETLKGRFLENGILMQSNADFFLPFSTRRKALRLLREGRIHLLGSDCHNTGSRAPHMAEAASRIQKHLGEACLRDMDALGRQLLVSSR